MLQLDLANLNSGGLGLGTPELNYGYVQYVELSLIDEAEMVDWSGP